MEKIRQSLGSKIMLAALAMCLVLCLMALSIGLGFYSHSIREAMGSSGFRLSSVLEMQLPADELLRLAAMVEKSSNHPIAQSLLKAAGGTDAGAENVQEVAGHGLIGWVQDAKVAVGNEKLMHMQSVQNLDAAAEGTVVHVAREKY